MGKNREKTENRFNLIDEPWIPITDIGMVSLRRIFQDTTLRSLGGNPIQKIALLKLLLAICQSAYTPEDDDEWKKCGPKGLAKKALEYLENHRDCFWLYGENPFLQMPKIKERIISRKKHELDKGVKEPVAEANAKPKEIGLGYYPDIPSENNTILTQDQISHPVSDAEKALFIVVLMNFAFGGKRVEKDIALFSPGYTEKTVSAKSGPSLGNHWGYLHSFITGTTIIETLWLNVFTQEYIDNNLNWEYKKIQAPWEKMPEGEDGEIARQLKNSYMGCLVAMCRFVLLEDDGIYYIEGIQYPSHKNGWREPSMCVDENTGKLLWTDPNKKPWRELTSLLAFLSTDENNKYSCPQLTNTLRRIKNMQMKIGIWSGGVRVRANSGDQSIKQDDDFVESETFIISSYLEEGFPLLEKGMKHLESLSEYLKKIVFLYCDELNINAEPRKNKALDLYWQLCNREYQHLVDACMVSDEEKAGKVEKLFIKFMRTAYENCCPHDTARQMQAWAGNYPVFKKQ
ncbi:type I-E CRISPR-associated protein Cse1/CasA [Spirochaetia bacterium]|nr:type I-E CRISPR-associated protein Cse1/CasA [Spirochaetia bacterium]